MGAVALVLAVSVSGCTGAASEALVSVAATSAAATSAPVVPIPINDLVGEWSLFQYRTNGGDLTVLDAPAPRLSFSTDGRLVDNSKCGGFVGDYVEGTGEMQLSPNSAPGLLCDSPIASGDLWQIGGNLSLEAGVLTLAAPTNGQSSGNNVTSFEFARPAGSAVPPNAAVENPGIPLESLIGKWKVTGYVTEGGEAVDFRPKGVRVTFFPSGRMIDTSLCGGEFDGDYVQSDGPVSFDNQATGMVRACYSPTATARLWGGATLSLDAGVLTVTSTYARLPGSADPPPSADFVRTVIFTHVSTHAGTDYPRNN